MNDLLVAINEHMPEPYLSTLLTALLALAAFLLRPKVSLIWGVKNQFHHILRPRQEDRQQINVITSEIIIHNTGRLPAREVEVVLNHPCDEISVWPQRQYDVRTNAENRQIVCLNFISPRENITVALLSIGVPLPEVLNVRCPERVGKHVEFRYHRQLHWSVYAFLWLLIFTGAVFFVRLIVDLTLGAA